MTKKYKNSPILFVVADTIDGIVAYITSQEYWEKFKHLDDCIRIPKDTEGPWFDMMEAVMGWYPNSKEEKTLEAAHNSMLKNGFVFSTEMAQFIAETGFDTVFLPTEIKK
jgi:hypothetical protein